MVRIVTIIPSNAGRERQYCFITSVHEKEDRKFKWSQNNNTLSGLKRLLH